MHSRRVKVKEVMSKNLITVRPEASVREIVHLLAGNKISGVPVVDVDGHLLGEVTEQILFPTEKAFPFSLERAPALMGYWIDNGRLRDAYAELRDLTAAEVMDPHVWTVDVDADMEEVVASMIIRRATRAPVVEKARVVGMITRHDVIRSMVREAA